jgi:predicted metal-dependent phosphoesterase TrpH
MHVHSYFSGPCTTPILGKFCRESYSDPREVFSVLERRGMDLFTLTDHDSIDGSAHLQERSNFFLSEELTCRMPSGTKVHIGVYDFHERQHAQLQQRRNDLVSLLMYLTERKLFFSINHVFSSVTGRRELGDFSWFRNYFPAIETPMLSRLSGRPTPRWLELRTRKNSSRRSAMAKRRWRANSEASQNLPGMFSRSSLK